MHLNHQPPPEPPTRPSRKGKERDPSHPPRETDIAEKIIAHQRKAAGPPRKDKERMGNPQPTPIAQQSSSTLLSSTAARTERTHRLPAPLPPPRLPAPSPRKPLGVIPRPAVVEADHEEFSRRLKISSHSPRLAQASHGKGAKLYNPDTDSIPIRRTAEPEQLSDTTGSSYVHVTRHPAGAQQREDRSGGPRQLFDYRKDDPVRFSVLARPPSSGSHTRPTPTPKASGDYLSASSTSSYAASVSSSTFTLSSTTDGSSASSALFDGRQGTGTEDSGNSNVFSKQLKRLYRTITELETKVKQEDANDDMDEGMNGRILLKAREVVNADADKGKWQKQISDHKDLAETIHNLLEISLAPSVPVSLRTIPTKYNIIVRLWTYAFHKLLESLRRASFTSPTALEHLQDFIYYAYTFYTGLLEENNLNSFKSSWLEALGDLARYKMAVSAMVNSGMGGQGGLTTKAVTEASKESLENTSSNTLAVPLLLVGKSVSDAPAARIDDSPSPSVGIAAARLLELEPEKERWRNIARDWYGAGLAEQPGTGKLHHHLGLLSREVESEELRGLYHFTKSMTCLHPFLTSRESVLPIWSHAAQARRALPDAKVPELFVLLHGMLFTNIQLDDFQPTLARFIERLDIEGAEEKEWIMMSVVNIASIMEYGRPNGVLRKLGVVGPKEAPGAQQAAMRVMAKKVSAGIPISSADDMMDVDAMQSPALSQMTPPSPTSELPDRPPALTYALQLTFAMLSLVLRRPLRQSSSYARSTLNPYLTVILTFLSTILKQTSALHVMERSIPWQELARFFTTIPRRVMASQDLFGVSKGPTSGDRWPMLTSNISPPLSEDWCMRGMEWVGRKVFERGYWKSGEERKAELEVLEQIEGLEISDGKIEDDDEENGAAFKTRSATVSELERRWIRICRSAVNISGGVDGLIWVEGTREWKVGGKLAQKVEQWKEEDRLERLEEERRRMGRRWTDDAMEIDDGDNEDLSSESEDDDEDDSDEVKTLKARRRYLKSLLLMSRQPASRPLGYSGPRMSKKTADSRPTLSLIPGYTIIVVDTNVLLTSLSMVTSLIESMKWTVVVPLPVVMELDGLASNQSPQLAEAASAAIDYISSHVRSHSLSLKVQTSKGNYLSSLNVRTEDIDFSAGDGHERSMDDLILKAAIWQDDHWQDRSGMLKVDPVPVSETTNAVKVVFVSLDRNLRLKARSRQLPAASERDIASLVSMAT